MMDDLDKRIELLKQAMAEPLTVPREVESADDLYQWLWAKLEARRRSKCEHGLNRHECGQCSE
jgi:hypothetical protein